MADPVRAGRPRPAKPPARALHARRAAALATGGGRLPPALRRRFDREARSSRAIALGQPLPGPARTRAGKRTPARAKRP